MEETTKRNTVTDLSLDVNTPAAAASKVQCVKGRASLQEAGSHGRCRGDNPHGVRAVGQRETKRLGGSREGEPTGAIDGTPFTGRNRPDNATSR
jgi:hypothetical protein